MTLSQELPAACFVGTRLEALQAVQRHARVVAIATVPDSWVHRHCIASHAKHYLIDRAVRANTFEFVGSQKVEIVFSAGCPLIFPPEVLSTGARFINSHPALLPQYKGYSPIKEGFHKGEEYMGVTVHEMVADVDSGPIIWQERVKVAGFALPQIYELLFGVVEPMAITRAFERALKAFH